MLERFLIIGLGNPGIRYRRTRHNTGFMVIERLGKDNDARFIKKKGLCEQAETTIAGRRVILAKPLTYMNNSGGAVAGLVQWYKIPLERLLIVVDDIDMPFGRLRLRPGGGSGGHKGLASIIEYLGTEKFARLRTGIGNEEIKRDVVKSVLSPFQSEERQKLEAIIAKARDAVICFIREGIDKAMTLYNPK